MLTLYIDGQLTPTAQLPAAPTNLIAFIPKSALPDAAQIPGIPAIQSLESRDHTGTRFESHDAFDYFALSIPSLTDPDADPTRVEIYCTPLALTILYEESPAITSLIADLRQHTPAAKEPYQVLYLFFAHLTAGDAAILENIEEEIAGLEDALVSTIPDNTPATISSLRGRLLLLKRYYEALFDLLEDFEENANGFLTKKQLHAFHLQTNRTDRLVRSVLNLRDYVTQVREAYQSQLDIGLNETMKLFTVVTTIFLPLSLIAGWFGMNLQMPEYSFPWMYPAVIIGSLIVVAICLVIFRKKRWI